MRLLMARFSTISGTDSLFLLTAISTSLSDSISILTTSFSLSLTNFQACRHLFDSSSKHLSPLLRKSHIPCYHHFIIFRNIHTVFFWSFRISNQNTFLRPRFKFTSTRFLLQSCLAPYALNIFRCDTHLFKYSYRVWSPKCTVRYLFCRYNKCLISESIA